MEERQAELFIYADNPSYDAFVEKFKDKKTTDDCYTPQNVYDAIAGWVAREYSLDNRQFKRPFWPGGDYENSDFIGFLAYNTIRRCEPVDPAYKGKECMDWGDPDDRLFLVKELGWACVGGHSDDCRKCVANEFCDFGMRYIEEESNGKVSD